jgi:hypothetical protein
MRLADRVQPSDQLATGRPKQQPLHPNAKDAEFRRRTKTQASLPSEEAVLFLLFGLLRSGQIRLRCLVGWQALANNNSHAEAA